MNIDVYRDIFGKFCRAAKSTSVDTNYNLINKNMTDFPYSKDNKIWCHYFV